MTGDSPLERRGETTIDPRGSLAYKHRRGIPSHDIRAMCRLACSCSRDCSPCLPRAAAVPERRRAGRPWPRGCRERNREFRGQERRLEQIFHLHPRCSPWISPVRRQGSRSRPFIMDVSNGHRGSVTALRLTTWQDFLCCRTRPQRTAGPGVCVSCKPATNFLSGSLVQL